MSTDLKNSFVLWKMGYLKDQNGILNRYYNEQKNWISHLSNTKSYILEIVNKTEPNNIAFLGSGWLLDIPFEEIFSKIKSVTLFDIIHPHKIKNIFKRNSNVKFENIDLTGGLVKQVYNYLYSKKIRNNSFIKKLQVHNSFDLSNFDLVISVNILSQLDIILKDKILSKIKLKEEDIEYLSTLIQSYHIKSLPKGKSCLITDYEELLIDKNGNKVKKNNLLYINLPEGENCKTWQWVFDTKQNYYKKYNVTFNVIALTF